MKDELVVFHAKQKKGDKDPNHTLLFKKENNVLICTYAKPHRGLDSYSKKFGKSLAEARMTQLLERIKTSKIQPINLFARRALKRYTPGTVASTMSYYAEKAARLLELGEDPKLSIRGQYADWDRYESEELDMVPTNAVVVQTTLKTITPKKKEEK